MMLIFPALSQGAVYQYFSGSMANNTGVNTTDGYKLRYSNRVNRPIGKLFQARAFLDNGNIITTQSSTLQPIILDIAPYYPLKSIARCQNVSGTFSINVSCWVIQ